MIKSKYIWLLLISLTITACSEDEDATKTPETPPPALNANGIDFSSYVSIGASFTAGYTDGALFKIGQENSFPNILSKQFAKANGGEFKQPLMNDNTGAMVFTTIPVAGYRFVFNGKSPQRLNDLLTEKGAPVPPPTTDAAVNLNSTFNNIGIPGAKSTHLLYDGYGNPSNLLQNPPTANPYFIRMASTTNATILGDAMAKKPTFFTLSEIGGNDVLGYAVSGGDGTDPITPPAGSIGVGFDQTFGYILQALTSGEAKGVVSTVPDITYLPHFTTVPHNPVPMDEATATLVNQAYAEYNGGLKQIQGLGAITEEELKKRTITFSEGQNAVVIVDENLTDLSSYNLPHYRQATSQDLLVLPSSSFIGTLADPSNPLSINGVAIPLADKWVLTPEEQLAIKTATDAYNTTITTLVNANNNLALLDLNAILKQAATTGIVFDNYSLTTNLVTGGLISLDGIHLTSRGYALMANKFLEVIDTKFGSNFIESQTVAKAINYPTNYSVNMP